MKIQSVQTNQTFQARFLNKSQLADARTILKKMAANNAVQEDEYKYSRRYLDSLELGEDKSLYKGLSDKTDGRTNLRLGKTKLNFDNETGEIISYKKPFFMKWSKIMENVSDFLSTANENFENKDIVKKHFTNVTTYTEKGSKKLNEEIKNKQRKLGRK